SGISSPANPATTGNWSGSSSPSWGRRAATAGSAPTSGGQARESERRDEQTEVAQGYVEVVAEEEQVDDDPREPGGDHVPTDLRSEGDQDTGHDLDDTDDEHGLVRRPGHQPVDLVRQVALPSGQHLDELVQPEQDRGDGEDGTQQ